MASWPLLPRAGSEVLKHQPSTIQGYIQENPPHQVQARAFNIEVNSVDVGILFRGQGHCYFFPRDVNLLSYDLAVKT